MATQHTPGDPDCLCTSCMLADMDATLAAQGKQYHWTGAEARGADTAVRTRYNRPGTRAGHGTVRLVSPKQVAFIKRLMRERDTRNLVRLPGSEDIERMSLAGARDLIDRLLACPELPEAQRPVDTANDAQRAFIKSLCERKGMADLSTQDMTRRQASLTIDRLKALKDAQRVVSTVDVREGIYRCPDGAVIRVRYTKQSRQLVGDTLTDGAWEYGGKRLLGKAATGVRLTLDEAKTLSVELGECCQCGATLTATVDGVPPRDRYIGPVCAGKFA